MRIIPGVTAETHADVLTGHEGSKFGLVPADAAPLIRRIEQSPRLRMQGLHVHVGIADPRRRTVRARRSPRWPRLGEFPVYDLGGGLGARYTWADDPPAVGDYLDALIGAAREHLPAEAQIIIEPGRSMVCESATTIYRVTTVKRGTMTFVAVDGGMGDNLEVALFEQRFEAGIVGRFDGPDPERVTVVGRHCESGDVLVDGVDLSRARGGRPARRTGHGCVLLHHVEQLQRQPPDPGGLRARRPRPPRRPPGDLGRPDGARRRLSQAMTPQRSKR